MQNWFKWTTNLSLPTYGISFESLKILINFSITGHWSNTFSTISYSKKNRVVENSGKVWISKIIQTCFKIDRIFFELLINDDKDVGRVTIELTIDVVSVLLLPQDRLDGIDTNNQGWSINLGTFPSFLQGIQYCFLV